MANKKQPLLKAAEHNWGLTGPGDWSKVRWLIFYDGSYEVVTTFNPSFEDCHDGHGVHDDHDNQDANCVRDAHEAHDDQEAHNAHNAWKRNERSKPVKRTVKGRMTDEDFSRICAAIKCEPWRDSVVDATACDGVAWEIQSYREDGSIANTSGKLGYIYGHRVLETIVSLLPDDGNLKVLAGNSCIVFRKLH